MPAVRALRVRIPAPAEVYRALVGIAPGGCPPTFHPGRH